MHCQNFGNHVSYLSENWRKLKNCNDCISLLFLVSQTIMNLMDVISANCPILKKFVFNAQHTTLFHSIPNFFPIEDPLQKKFLMLTNLVICFKGLKFPGADMKGIFFKDYLLVKCPRVDKILMKKKIVTWTKVNRIRVAVDEQIVFSSDDNELFRKL